MNPYLNGTSPHFNRQLPNQKGIDQSFRAKFGGIGGWGLAFAGMDTIANIKAGDDLGTAGVKAAASAMLWTAAPKVMGMATIIPMIPQATQAYMGWKKKKEDWWNMQHLQGNVGGQYQDSQRALTMRQAAVQQIQGSKLNARSALGGEAMIIGRNQHRG